MLKFIGSLSAEIRREYLIKRLKSSDLGSFPVLIVPEQFLFESERSMYKLLGAEKIAQTEITGFSKLAADVIGKYGEPKLYADNIVKSLTMYKTLSQLKSNLQYYNSVSYSAASRMLGIVANLKSAALDPCEFERNFAESAESADSPLFLKLSDIARIYPAYCDSLSQGFADKLDDILRAAVLLFNHDCFRGREIFISEFDGFSQSQIALIKALSESAENVELLLRTDSKISSNSELRSMNILIKRLERNLDPNQIGEFVDLGGEANSPKVELRTADNIADECEFIAAQIRRLITQCGYSCNEIAVLMPDSKAGTVTRLKESLAEYDIACYADLPEPIITKPMTRFIVCALDALNAETPALLSYIRSGFVRVRGDLENYESARNLVLGRLDNHKQNKRYEHSRGGQRFTRRLSKRSMDLLERAAFRFALTKREWVKPFPESNRILHQLEPLRSEIVNPLLALKKACTNKSGDRITEALCEFLLETMQLQRTVQGIAKQGGKSLDKSLDKSLEDEFRQLWDLNIDVFESLHAFFKNEDGETMNIAEYSDILRGVFASVDIAKPPAVLDAVVIGELERSRLSGIKVAFVMGANLGCFPKRTSVGENSAFSSRELESLSEIGMEILPNPEERYNFERFMLNKAMTLPSELLFITAPLSNAAWEELLPSPIFAELSQKQGLTINKTSDLPTESRIWTVKSARRILAEENHPLSDLPSDLLQNLFVSPKIFSKNFSKEFSTDEHVLTPETADKLFNFERFSPTAIETMMSCRFKFFCRYGLGLDLPISENDEEPAAMERGNLIHYCLDCILREYKDRLEGLGALTDSQLGELVLSAIREYRNTKLPAGYAQTKRQEYILMSFKSGIVKMLKHICGDFADSGFKPADFERKFDFALNENIRLIGKIDRVDKLSTPDGDFVRVVDYKSGNKEMDFPSVFYGLDMQMLLYLFAVCNGETARPAAALYLPSDGGNVASVLPPDSRNDESALRKNWLSSHIPSGVVVEGNPGVPDFEAQQNRYRNETNSTAAKKFFSVRRLSPTSYAKLKNHCEKLVDVQVKRLKRGNISAIPLVKTSKSAENSNLSSPVCDYCDFSASCFKKKNRTVRKELIERVVSQSDENLD
ncbi:MAG: PD-(D/E)XK nuclease family protein [Oscillospiraceae bacterium]|nr:PD-(D/E)XK nuclease family protein [Oscillospiraceae bacterium]